MRSCAETRNTAAMALKPPPLFVSTARTRLEVGRASLDERLMALGSDRPRQDLIHHKRAADVFPDLAQIFSRG